MRIFACEGKGKEGDLLSGRAGIFPIFPERGGGRKGPEGKKKDPLMPAVDHLIPAFWQVGKLSAGSVGLYRAAWAPERRYCLRIQLAIPGSNVRFPIFFLGIKFHHVSNTAESSFLL